MLSKKQFRKILLENVSTIDELTKSNYKVNVYFNFTLENATIADVENELYQIKQNIDYYFAMGDLKPISIDFNLNRENNIKVKVIYKYRTQAYNREEVYKEVRSNVSPFVIFEISEKLSKLTNKFYPTMEIEIGEISR